MRDADYYDYIQSEAWREKSRQRMTIDGHKCQGCGTSHGLQVHHATYIRWRNERLDDLVTVCGQCHDAIHKAYRPGRGASLAVVTRKVLKQLKPAQFTEWKKIDP